MTSGGQADRDHLRYAEIAGGQRDANEFRDDRQRVQDEEIDDAERAPETAEALHDQPGVADAGDRAQAQHHFLVHVQHRDQQDERPQQPGAVVLAGLAVDGERAGVVVADHDDQPRADDGQQRLQLGGHAPARRQVVQRDGAERAADVADVRGVQCAPRLRLGTAGRSDAVELMVRHPFRRQAQAGSGGARGSDQRVRLENPEAGAVTASARARSRQGSGNEGPFSARTIVVHCSPPFVRDGHPPAHAGAAERQGAPGT